MGTKERRAREQLATREKILDAARDMFTQKGYDAVTMRAIAERIEYTPTAIYHHFKNKHALLTELSRSDFRELARHFNSGKIPADPVERVVAVGEAYLRFAMKHPSQYRFMFMTVIPKIEHEAETRDNPEVGAYAFLRESCRAAIADGRLRPEITDADELAQIAWAIVHGVISLQMVKAHADWIPWRDLRATARKAMWVMIRGLLRDPAEKRRAPKRS